MRITSEVGRETRIDRNRGIARRRPFGPIVLATSALAVLALLVSPTPAAVWSSPFTAELHAVNVLPFPTPIRHVVVIFMENTEASNVLSGGSYERYLAEHYAYAGNYFSVEHYSLPNYLAATSGQVTNRFHTIRTQNIGDLAQKANRTWGAYMESMPTPCAVNSTAQYDVYHNPFLMYQDVIGNSNRCLTHDVNFTVFENGLAANKIPNYAFISPNVTDDAHDRGVAPADAWLHSWLSPFVNSSLFKSTAVFITYDEGSSNLGVNGTGGGHVYTVLVSPFARMGFTSEVAYSHYNLLSTSEWLLGVGHLGAHDNWTTAPPMTDLFQFAVQHPFSGTVIGVNVTALVGATVSAGNGTLAYTNAAGGYTLSLPRGTYVVTASAPGYSAATQTLVIYRPVTSAVNFTLTLPAGGHLAPGIRASG